MSFEKNLRRFSRALPPVQPPADLRNHVFHALPDPQPSPRTGRYLAVGVVLAVCAGIFFLPRLLVKASFAQEMRTAIERAQTWHFVGWRLREGKQIRWEIWGRRTPYFYREQIGDDIQIEDGTQRIRLIPPDANRMISREVGLAILMPAAPLPTKAEPQKSNDLLAFARGIGGERWQDLWFSEDDHKTEGPVRMRGSTVSRGWTDINTFLIADRHTKLPIRLEIHDTRYKEGSRDTDRNRPIQRQFQEALLEAQYNVPLPEDVEKQNIPANYRRVDFTQGLPEAQKPDGSMTRNGLTVQGEAIAQDDEGNLRLRFRAIFGNQPFKAQELPLDLDVMYGQFSDNRMDIRKQGNQYRFLRQQVAIDDRGNHYRVISNPPVLSFSDAPEMYLVPIEPFAPNTPRPTRLSLWIDVRPQFYKMGEDDQIVTVPIMQEKMQLSIPLPQTVAPTGLGYDTASSPQVILTQIRWSLALYAAQARSSYYADWRRFGQIPGLPRAEVIPDLERAIYWYEAAATEAKRLGLTREAADFQRYAQNQRRDLEAYQEAGR